MFENNKISDTILLNNLQQLEEAVTIYCRGKAQYLAQPIAFNFSLLTSVADSIKLLPLDNKKIELMERFHQHVYQSISGFHPKICYSMNFTSEIAKYKPLLGQLDALEKQALELYKHYFDVQKPGFDWQGLTHVRAQISKLPDNSSKTELMQLFEQGVLATIIQIEPKAYSSYTFKPELEEFDAKQSPLTQSGLNCR